MVGHSISVSKDVVWAVAARHELPAFSLTYITPYHPTVTQVVASKQSIAFKTLLTCELINCQLSPPFWDLKTMPSPALNAPEPPTIKQRVEVRQVISLSAKEVLEVLDSQVCPPLIVSWIVPLSPIAIQLLAFKQ